MNVTKLTQALVSIPSVNPNSLASDRTSPGEAAMADFIEQTVKDLGATSIQRTNPYPGRPNILAYFDFGASATLIFDAHMDTVPVDGMTVDPYLGEIRDGKLYGRGTCDVKGPLAAMLCAISNLKQGSAPAPRYNILLAALCDEESGFGGIASFISNIHNFECAPIAGAVVAEPTLLNPVVAHKGTVRWGVSTSGIAAHSSTPHLGENAIYRMAPVILRLQEHAAHLQQRPPHATLGTPTLSIGTIHGGSAVNIVPDACEILVDRRLVPGETVESAQAELEQALAGLACTVSSPTVAAPSMATDENDPLVIGALAAARHAGANPQVEYANYCTHASFYPQANIPVIVFGPGSIAQAHTKDEWITIEQLEMGVAAYQQLVR